MAFNFYFGDLNLQERIKSLNLQKNTEGLNLVLLGKIGAGKSASGNTILGREAFQSKEGFTSVTQYVAVEYGWVCGRQVTVYDTPGWFNTTLSEEEIQKMINKNVLQRCESGLCVFLLVIKADRFTGKEREAVEKIEKLLGEERLKKTWILFTGRDELEEENMTIEEFINQSEPLKRLVQKYDHRYHVFNNKPNGQVQELLTKIYSTYPDTIGSSASMRIVLLGQTGVGKSAAGNTILGQKEFRSQRSTSSVTRECSAAHGTVSGRSVSVVDAPGLYHTEMRHEELVTEIARSIYLSSPGPHAFLIVFPVNNRFTEHEQLIPQMIEMMFGEEVLKYSIILFTHGDLLEGKPIEELIQENCRLRDLVGQCGGRFHVFNNKDENNRDQVNDLLKKIDTMIEQNGGGHYSNLMFEDAQRFRREERQRRREERWRATERRQREQETIRRLEKRRQREQETIRRLEERRPRAKEKMQRLEERRPRAKEKMQRLEYRLQRLKKKLQRA